MELKKGVILLIILIVVGIVFFSATNSIANNLIIGKAGGLRGTCFDTDGGLSNNIFVKGTVSGDRDLGGSYERTDYCITPYWLKEYNCDSSQSLNFKTDKVYCKNGCRDGVCII